MAVVPQPAEDHSQGHLPDRTGAVDGRYSDEAVARNAVLVDRIHSAQRVMSVAVAEILSAASEADEGESYWADGAQATDEWLVGNLRIHSRTARRWARLARKLRDYPETRKKLASGELNLDQLVELMKYLDPENEAEVLEAAVFESADDLADTARSQRTVSRERVKQTRSERWFEGFFDHDDMKYTFAGEIPGQDGLIVDKALQLLAWNAAEEPVYELPRHPEHRLADALVEMASNALGNHSNTDVATVVLHVDAERLADTDSVGSAEFASEVPMEAIRRMCCDGRLQLVTRDDYGVLGVGRVRRTIPGWLRRLVRQRDKGCRFPGCRRTYWTEIHHIIHWAHGGPTDLDNLVTLCGHHHRMLHEDQWRISGDPNSDVVFHLPSGTPFHRQPGKRDWETLRNLDLTAIHHWIEQHHPTKPNPG
ncbi:MAG: DUF222 domain-containing protein [Acidimicrobiales bacterium]|nr:DUF222 domain-containing protein [Acidimicrobiales bacterium]